MLITIDVPARPKYLEAALSGLVALDRVVLRAQQLPELYESGIVYRREPAGQERWLRIDEMFALGYGDCEDLTAARVAELQLDGEGAYQKVRPTGWRRFHAVVRRGDGEREDPSRILGMEVR